MKHVVCFALCTLVPSLALGQPGDQALPPPSKPVPANLTGLTFAAGVGYGMPFGEIKTQLPGYADQRLGSYIASQVPLTLTAGYRPIPFCRSVSPSNMHSCPRRTAPRDRLARQATSAFGGKSGST
jgi:hypothetical protein